MRKLIFAALILLVFVVLCNRPEAQVAVTISPVAKQQFLDASGRPFASGKLYTYSAGTTSPLATYTDSTGTSQNTNPIILDSGGYTPSGLFLSGNSYKFVLKNAGGVTQWTVDGVNQFSVAFSSTFTGNNTFTGTNTFSGPTIFSGTATFTGSLLCKNFESTRCADQYASGSTTGGIQEAYAAGASTGVHVMLGADITISTAQTLTLTTGKPLWLDFNGRKLTCTNTTGICLKVLKPDADPRYPLEIYNGTIAYSGSSSSITGLSLGNGSTAAITNVILHGMTFNNFNSTGGIALDLNNCEDCTISWNNFNQNTLAWNIQKDSNDVTFSDNKIQIGTNALVLVDAWGVHFIRNLIQSTTGAITAQITSSTQVINSITFDKNWFENNGDGTSASRVFTITANNSHLITGLGFTANIIEHGTNGVSGKVYEFTGDGSTMVRGPVFTNNVYSYATADVFVGSASTAFPIICNTEFSTWCDVGFNFQNNTGLHFFPKTGHHFQMYAGDTVQLGNANDLLVKDLTATKTVFQYSNSLLQFIVPQLGTATNCASSASPAVCASSAAGAVALPAAGVALVVNTTAVTANSEIMLSRADYLGTRLSVTCNAQSSLVLGTPRVAGITAGVGFTINVDAAPTTNPMCIAYHIIN